MSEDFTVTVSTGGTITSIRGKSLPEGLLFAPVRAGVDYSISATAMDCMTAAIAHAVNVQQRACRQSRD